MTVTVVVFSDFYINPYRTDLEQVVKNYINFNLNTSLWYHEKVS